MAAELYHLEHMVRASPSRPNEFVLVSSEQYHLEHVGIASPSRPNEFVLVSSGLIISLEII